MQLKFAIISLLIITFFYIVIFSIVNNGTNKNFFTIVKETWVIFLGLIIYFSILFSYGD